MSYQTFQSIENGSISETIFLQICSALNYLHSHKRPIVHRDIQCSNIMLTEKNIIKMCDFGIARQLGIALDIFNNKELISYAMQFMAPELFSKDCHTEYTPKSDVWAFGCSLFEMTEMKPPNDGANFALISGRVIQHDMPDLPGWASPGLRDFYRRCVERDPRTRAETVELLQHTFIAQAEEGATACSNNTEFASWKFVLRHEKKLLIGKGGFGKVYKAVTSSNQVVAVKVVKLDQVKHKILDKVIEGEKGAYSTLKSIRHPNIAQFLKYEQTLEELCIITELISGQNLSEVMHQQQKPFDEPDVKTFSQQICSGLNFLHTRKPAILHRDIKCTNIMLTDQKVIKIIDFGIAKEVLSTSIKHITNNAPGTLYYMAPELLNEDGRMVYTPKSDVWAFGCSVFEMTEMKPPNDDVHYGLVAARVTKRDMPDLPGWTSPSLRDFYRRCVERDPKRRAETAELLQHKFLRK